MNQSFSNRRLQRRMLYGAFALVAVGGLTYGLILAVNKVRDASARAQ